MAKHYGIKTSQAKKILESIEGYTLHREYKQPKRYNPYFVHGRREQVQADLIDISLIHARNDGVKFLLLLIDIFTKKIWVYPLRNKAAASVKAALINWLNDLRVRPKILKTDRGLEFTARPIQQLLQSRGVEWQAAYGTLKACIAERVNKTLQILIYKYMTQNETTRYIDVLPRLVTTYNRRPHRTLEGMTPNMADLPRNENRIRTILLAKYAETARWRRDRLPFSVGDVVRIKTEPKKLSSSSRAYALQFQGEHFTIIRINRTLPVAMYYLRSSDTGELIKGGFYANELQRHRGQTYMVERVLRGPVMRQGRMQVFVKWRYFGPRWNSWIPVENVHRVF